MNLRHLHAFAAIVDVGGLAKAATRLHLSQPALSRQIQALEADLGVALFDRIGRRVQLTSQGEDLLLRSRRLGTNLSERSAPRTDQGEVLFINDLHSWPNESKCQKQRPYNWDTISRCCSKKSERNKYVSLVPV